MMCKKVMPVYCENHTEYANKYPVDERQTYFNVTAGGTYINQGAFNTLRTGDADLRFYITTVQDG